MYICIFFNNQTGKYIIQATKNPIKTLAKLLGDSSEHNKGWRIISKNQIFAILPEDDLEIIAKAILDKIFENNHTLQNYLDLWVPRYELDPQNLLKEENPQTTLISAG